MNDKLLKRGWIFLAGLFLVFNLIPIETIYAGIIKEDDSLIEQTNDQTNEEEKTTVLPGTVLQKATLTEGAFLSIDNVNIYNGMQKSFEEGYSPAVKDETVFVTIPVISSETLLNDELSGRIIFETEEDAPFQKINYQKTVRKQLYTFDQEIEAYVFQYELPLLSGYKNGQYIIYLETSGELEDGQSFIQKFTLYVSITDGATEVKESDEKEDETKDETKENSEDDTDVQDISLTEGGSAYESSGSVNGTAEEVKYQPRVMLDSYEIENGTVQAGDSFSIPLTFKNTNKSAAVYNAKVSVECETTDVIFDKNSFYIEKVESEQTFTITLSGSVAKECALKNAKVNFTINYEDKDAAAIQDAESMILRIRQPVNVQAGELSIPDTVYASETIPVSIQVMNLGRSQISNVRMEIAAPGISPISTLFIGNMEPGTAIEGEVKVFIEAIDEGTEKYGESAGTYTLYYEDEYGEEYSESFDFSTTIKEPEVIAAAVLEEESETVGQWWISVLVGAGILGLVAGIPLVKTVLRKWRLEHARE